MSPALAPDQVVKAREMRAQGATYSAIAKQLGVSISGVHYRLDPRTPEKTRRRLTEVEKAQIRALRSQGATVKELVVRFGVNETTVRTHSTDQDPKPAPDAPPPTPDELVLSAFPWAWRLTQAERDEFRFGLAHRPKGSKERDIDRFITQWHHRAEKRAS